MKLRNKIYLLQLLIALSFVFFFFVFYSSYIKQKEKDLDNNVQTILQTNKSFVEQYLKNIYKNYQYNQDKFYTIHQFAQNEYLKSSKKNLNILKEKIKKQFNIKNMDIDIFIINKNYVITHSTFQKDIGFNLGKIEDAKKYLDKTKIDGKIYIAENLSFDILDSNTNIYSYSK